MFNDRDTGSVNLCEYIYRDGRGIDYVLGAVPQFSLGKSPYYCQGRNIHKSAQLVQSGKPSTYSTTVQCTLEVESISDSTQ